jgi:cytochrome P450
MTVPNPAVPVIELDPTGTDHHGEAARLRAAGPVVRVILPGNVHAWVVTEHALLADLVVDPRVSKNWRNWTAIRTGQIPDNWPLIGMIQVTNMVTMDDADHHRLRRPVTSVFTRNRVAALGSRIRHITTALLDALPSHTTPHGVVDLRQHYAYPVPMQVICELVGVPESWRPDLRTLVDSIFRSDTTAEEVADTQRDRITLLHALVALRRGQPANDLTSDLIALRDDDAAALSDEELIDTLWLLLTAGHETTLGLITNATRALLTHPEQLDIALHGDDKTWAQIVEETLRWDSPIGNFPARYPLEDVTIAGVTIPAGDAILAPYSGVGRDPRHHGPDADRFDITRAPQKHLAFGGGAHFCLGAHLARLETTVALQELFTRHPDLTLATDPSGLTPVASLFSNVPASLPVRLST